MTKANASILCILLAAVLTACGTVLTPQPTPGPTSTATPLPGETLAIGPAGTAPALPLADTATPTVSPTPIVYVVQSGDTLLGIAMEYGVSVEAIQRANGIENPQFLRVGQELLIPTGEEEKESSSGGLLLPTPTPIPFDVQGVACYETPASSLWCLGEVVNTAPAPVTNVQMLVTLFDSDGQRMAEADTFVAADLIPPGDRAPFGVLFVDPPPGQTVPRVTTLRGEVAGELTASYVSMSAVEIEGKLSGPQFEVSGKAQNDSTERSAGRVSVTVTTYDANGFVTGFRQEAVELEAPLAPGTSAPFSMLLNFHGDSPADFSIVAIGLASTE
ncbi:MAG: LysM peptidoglycan-binding domain-containing protein [Anaerolineae bacterium]|nr:LysM peptidoglycan-binding domain-containing protein [Anaerolineae bacterium]